MSHIDTEALRRKIAAINVEQSVLGILGRRKKRQRGFFFDRSPGMHGVRAGFESAARSAGKLAALRSFGVLHGKDDPSKALTALFRTNHFGLKRRGPVTESRASLGLRAFTGEL